MIQPLLKTYRVTTPFKFKNSVYYSGYHTGIDFATPTGTKVVAVNKGKIVASQFDNSGFGYGNYITLYDGKYYWRYAHLSKRSVKVGQTVAMGKVLGLSGNTGLSSGPHLHFECATNNSFTAPISSFRDPLKVIKENSMSKYINRSQYNVGVRHVLARAGTKPEQWVGKVGWDDYIKKLKETTEFKQAVKDAAAGKLTIEDLLQYAPIEIRKAYKPPQVVDDYEEVKEKLYRRKK